MKKTKKFVDVRDLWADMGWDQKQLQRLLNGERARDIIAEENGWTREQVDRVLNGERIAAIEAEIQASELAGVL